MQACFGRVASYKMKGQLRVGPFALSEWRYCLLHYGRSKCLETIQAKICRIWDVRLSAEMRGVLIITAVKT